MKISPNFSEVKNIAAAGKYNIPVSYTHLKIN